MYNFAAQLNTNYCQKHWHLDYTVFINLAEGVNKMKKVFYIRKTVCIFLMLVILATALPVLSYGSTETQGSCGDNLTWKLEYRVLTISGKGQ